MTKKTAYISGPITGLNMDIVSRQFAEKEEALRAQGYNVINPVVRIINLNFSRKRFGQPALSDEYNRKEIMGICLYDLSTCDELHLLPDWQESQGAITELEFARRFGIKVVYSS